MRAVIKDTSQHLVLGEVYVPLRLDSDNEFMQKEEIEAAARRFMLLNVNDNIDREHNFQQSEKGDTIVQSYIAKDNDPDGFVEGSWIAEGYIRDPERWEAVQRGELNGWSMAGHADKIPRTITVTALTSMKTETLPHEDHSHPFLIKFDESGRVLPSQTEVVDGHYHNIRKTTATDEANGHSHRFDVHWDDNTQGITKEEKTIEARELINVHPTWLSLVRHAAVRRGFKVVKSDQPRDDHGRFSDGTHKPRDMYDYEKNVHFGGSAVADAVPNINRMNPVVTHTNIDKEEVTKMDRVVHAIIAERDYDLSDILNKEDLLWDNDAEISTRRMVTVAKGEKHILLEREEFEEGSLKVMKLGDVDIVAGILKSDTSENVLKAPKKLKKEEETFMTRDEIQEMIKGELQSAMASELGALKSDLMGAIAKLDIAKENTQLDTDNQTSEEMPEEEIEKCKTKKAEYTQRPSEAQPEGQKASDGEPTDFRQELALLKAEISKMTKAFTSKTDELVQKTDKIMSKGVSSPGAYDENPIEITKSEKEDGFWAGRLFARNNPKIERVLRSK